MSVRSLLLSDDPAQRTRIGIWAVGALSYVLYSLIQSLQVSLGLMDLRESNLLIAAMVGSSACFYAVYRSGWCLRIGDAPLTLMQLVLGVVFGLWSYAITGAARGAILMIILSSVVYGAFSLRAAQARWMTLGTLAGLGLVMLWRSQADPAGYPPAVETVHFLFAAVALTVISRLSAQLSGLRAQLGRQARELKHAMEQLRLLATRDELTQIHNRRHMTELMAIQCRQQARSHAPLCVALLDIDLFKRINDTWGHHAGDLVLQRFARAATESLRASDLLCRWGGEEFLVMFPDTPPDQAVQALARLHERLRGERIDGLPDDERITFSAGLTAVIPGEAIEATTERADQAMYRAKTGGRDRTVLV